VDLVPRFINGLYHYAWFVGFAVSGAVYWLLAKVGFVPGLAAGPCRQDAPV
jgi:cytosine/uracil/thiamine/allantoin permease